MINFFILCRYVIQPSATPSEPKIGVESTNTGLPDGAPPAKKRKRGQNKHRPRPAMLATSNILCSSLYSPEDDSSLACRFGDKCKYTHDVQSFMDSKLPDISENCYLFEIYGKCMYGRACRYGSKHLTSDNKNIVNKDLYDPTRAEGSSNVLSKTLQEQLRKRSFEFARSEAYLTRMKHSENNEEVIDSTVGEQLPPNAVMSECVATKECVSRSTVSEDNVDMAKLRPAEKKKVFLYWHKVLNYVITQPLSLSSLTYEENFILLH